MRNIKHLGRIKAIIFDWDMTLARVLGGMPRNHILAALFQRGGISCTYKEVAYGMSVYQANLKQGHIHPTHVPPQTRADIMEYYQNILTCMGYGDLSESQLEEFYHDYAFLPTELYHDTLPVLQTLQSSEFQLGIISNHTSLARSRMETLVGTFISSPHIVISDEVGLYKPDQSIFHYAARQLALPPEECAFVGDNLQVDAIGAVQYGGFTLGLWLDRQNNGPQRNMPVNVNRITALSQVKNYVNRLQEVA